MGKVLDMLFPAAEYNNKGDALVHCPFPHKGYDDIEYVEDNPSAGISNIKDTFHCFQCKRKFSETGLLAELYSITYTEASKLKQILERSSESLYKEWSTVAKNFRSDDMYEYVSKVLGFSDEVIKQLHLGSLRPDTVTFPVTIDGYIINKGTYRPKQKDTNYPKLMNQKGKPVGMIYPYDLWIDDNRPTLICAGEKDMAIARTHGFNAITITGGELSLPKLFKGLFKDKIIFIAYDNDDSGRRGASQLAAFLKPVAKTVRVIDLSETCTVDKEDLWDYFMKYKKTAADLKELSRNSAVFSQEDLNKEKERTIPTVSLLDAVAPQNFGKILRSNVQVVTNYEVQFTMPTSIIATKKKLDEGGGDTLALGTTREWGYDANTAGDLLYLVDNNLTESKISDNIRNILKLPPKEKHMQINTPTHGTVFKSVVRDNIETEDGKESKPLELTAYSVNKLLENGKKYKLTYKLVPDPHKGQRLLMIVLDYEEASDSVSKFRLNESVIESLKKFQVTTTLQDKLKELVEKVRGILNADINTDLILIEDLWFHTMLKFNVGKWKNLRAYLDTFIVGESRTGKSATAEALRKTYGLGTVVDLPTVTVGGLIGGSHGSDGNYQTRAGILPQSNKGAVILEELAKAKSDIMRELTAIRSSNRTRITRVSGFVDLETYTRTLVISNPKVHGGVPKPISSYPNGMEIITDLVNAAEDIARFDMIAVFSFMADDEIDMFKEFEEPMPTEDYRNRIRWIWSRKPDQVVFSPESLDKIRDRANELSKEFNSHIKIFGTETWMKLTRLATAIAGYVCSATDDFESIVVKEDHIDFAAKFLRSLYDNDTFRFKEYVAEENKTKTIDEAGIAELEEIYIQAPEVIEHLANKSSSSRNNLSAISGLDNGQFSKLINRLVTFNFISFQGYEIHPTERFRKGHKRMNKVAKPKHTDVSIKKSKESVWDFGL